MQDSGTREQIVGSAAGLIWRRGYSRTTVDDIIRNAGICKGSFYHHFTSKESLGLAVIDDWTAHFASHIRARLADDRSPVENLHAILDAMVSAQQESGYLGCPLGRLALEMGDVSENFRIRLQEAFDQMRGLFSTYLQQAGMSEEEACEHGRYMLATLEGALMLEKVRGGGKVLDGLVATMKTDVSRRLVEVAI
jgi:TetR/AcrR family transcriptional repressor of nem operon